MTKELKKQRAKWELELELLKILNDFKSKEEPYIPNLSNSDKVKVLASIIMKSQD